MFHCSNLPKDFFEEPEMSFQDIIAGTVGKENTYGTVVGWVKSGPFTYCRVSTDDARGTIRAYLGEGQITDEPLDTFGGFGVIEIPEFQGLLRHICENGYEHHVAMNRSQVAAAVKEALGKYMGWDVYYHAPAD
jgi:L-fucose isomerase-like protein